VLRNWFLFALVGPAAAEVHLHFDELPAGSPVSAQYAPVYGVSFLGLGDGGPFEVITDTMCAGSLSAPHVLSLRALESCPEANDQTGFFEVSFPTDQAFVSVRTLLTVSGAVPYLKAYSGPQESDLLDQKFGDFELLNAPQTLRIDRQPSQAQIRRVRFGVFNLDNRVAAFDDLRFERAAVSTAETAWGAVKSRW
jgi:hypothetical protein